jgi:hypothetical protein
MPQRPIAAVIACCLSLPVWASDNHSRAITLPFLPYQYVQSYSCGKTCGRVRSCRDAVYQWCVCGYARADGDNDGVPCERHCGQSSAANRARVKAIKQEFGCS